MSPKGKFSCLNYSSLEGRRLLTISAFLDTGVLTIIGDSSSNTAEVREISNQLEITGDNDFSFASAGVTLIRFYGGDGDDMFENFTSIDTLAAGHDGNDTLRTAGGADRLYGGPGNDFLLSTGGDDLMVGNDGADTFFAGEGNDSVYGLLGDDVLNGEGGDDILVAGYGDDVVHGGDGEDLVYGHFGDDMIFGGDGNDRLYGQDDNDTIEGNDGDDIVRGNIGLDTLYGNEGNDRMLGDFDADMIYGGNGNDTVFAGDGDDIVYGGNGNDLLYAGNDNDTVYGEAGNDIVRGNAGDDILEGGANADRLVGNDGNDRLDGGGATDFVFGDNGVDTVIADSNDFVRPGAGDDILELSDGTNDVVALNGNYSNFVVTQQGETLIVRDTTGADGQDVITGADSLQFDDQTRTAEPDVTQRIFIQPIVVSNDDGSNAAEFFGNAEQEFDIKRRIDEIYLQAAIDVEWLDANTLDNTFFNLGNGSGERPESDLNTMLTQGDSLGVGSPAPLTLDMYFVERVPGFALLGENTANGLAFVDFNGIAMHTGDNLPAFADGRQVTARVAAHEIAHNLGLSHVAITGNLMDQGDDLNSSQIDTIRGSQFSLVI